MRLMLEVSNGGGAGVLPVEPSSREMTVLFGQNRTEAESAVGFAYPDAGEQRRKALDVDGPTRIVVGSSARFVESSLVPVDGLGLLTVVVALPATDGVRDPWTFTGVESLLKTVK